MPCALIGDVKGSRQLDNWPEIFKGIQKTLREVNRRFAEEILVKFKPTVGDEFQGALNTPRRAYDVYTFIKASLPAEIYCGIGIGKVELESGAESGLRGTAFYRARSALEQCKKHKGSLRVQLSEARGPRHRCLNALLLLKETIEGRWTKRQKEVINLLRLHPGLSLVEAGKRFGVTHSAISQNLKSAHFEEIQASEGVFHELLGDSRV